MFWYNLITVMGDRATQECDPSTMAAPNGMGWYLFRFQPFMIMPVASKRKTPASLEAVDLLPQNSVGADVTCFG
jgi:hypothetical protein